MSVQNIDERRRYIAQLLAGGAEIDIRRVAQMFGSSFPSVKNDIYVITTGKAYYKKSTATGQNTRARKLGIKGLLTQEDWTKTLERFDYSCAHCGAKENLSVDHIIPISRGGTNTPENIQPLCKSCNSKKGNRIPRENGKRGGRPRKATK